MIEHKNTILAIVLSLIVVVGWQFFVGYPQMDKQRRDAELKQQQQTQLQPQGQPGTGQSAPRTGTPAGPGGAAPATQPATNTREAVIAAAPRIAIDTPRLKGSIDLKGA